MVLFFPIQQELDCISAYGHILGKIKCDISTSKHVFIPDNESVTLSDEEQIRITVKIVGLDSGKFSISMQDDD